MSSITVRTAIKGFIAAQIPAEKRVDLDGGYLDIDDHLAEYGLTVNDDFLGFQFIPNDEAPVTVPATNGQGKFRETGSCFLHIVSVAKLGVRDSILTRAEALRNVLRGRNISGVRVRSVTPPNFELGATLEFEAGYMSASILVEYDYELDL